jgi:outer membrane protein assembly factor BamB
MTGRRLLGIILKVRMKLARTIVYATFLLSMLLSSLFAQRDKDPGVFHVDDIGAQSEGVLLKRAEQLEKSKEWAKAVKAYLEILLKTEKRTSLVIRPYEDDPRLWIGVHRYIMTRLAKIPAEGFCDWRLDHDPKLRAKAITIEKEGNLATLEESANTFFYCSQADDILNRIANLYLEMGQLRKACRIWDKLLNFYPDLSVPEHLLVAKLALAYQYLGDQLALKDLEEHFKDKTASIQVGSRSIQLYELLKQVKVKVHPAKDYASDKGGKLSCLWSSDCFTQGRARPPSRHRLRQIEKRIQDMLKLTRINIKSSKIVKPWVLRPIYTPATAILKDGRQVLICQDGFNLAVVELTTGKPLWRYPSSVRKNRPGVIDKRHKAERDPISRVAAIYGCKVDAGHLYVNMHDQGYKVKAPDFMGVKVPCTTSIGPDVLACFDINTGQRIWSYRADKGTILCTAPLISGKRLYLPALKEGEAHLFCIDKDSGTLLWKTFICSYNLTGGNVLEITFDLRFPFFPTITRSGKTIYCLTNLGCVTAIDAESGHILWLRRYSTAKIKVGMMSVTGFSRPPNPPVFHQGMLYCMPQDSKYLYILDGTSGKVLYEGKHYSSRYYNDSLLGLYRDTVLMVAGARLLGFSVGSQKLSLDIDIKDKKWVTQPVLYRGLIYLPTPEGLRIFDPWKRKYIHEHMWGDKRGARMAHVLGEVLVLLDPYRVTIYTLAQE